MKLLKGTAPIQKRFSKKCGQTIASSLSIVACTTYKLITSKHERTCGIYPVACVKYTAYDVQLHSACNRKCQQVGAFSEHALFFSVSHSLLLQAGRCGRRSSPGSPGSHRAPSGTWPSSSRLTDRTRPAHRAVCRFGGEIPLDTANFSPILRWLAAQLGAEVAAGRLGIRTFSNKAPGS